MNTKKIMKIIIILLLITLVSSSVYAAIGKKTYAKNKYIWIYINDERKLLPSGYGYPCYGQGTDNKNILYIPLSVITDMTGCEVSALQKEYIDGSYSYYAEVTGERNFKITLYDDVIDGVKLAGEPFILKGTSIENNVIMVPLGFVKDYFGLTTEVKKPVGRGVYDYCSMAINITGGITDTDGVLIDTPTSGNEDNASSGSDRIVYVHAEDSYYHEEGSALLEGDTMRVALSEYEALYWGYTPYPGGN